ncbi:BatA domain-containing protein [Tenacibaculum finnmarkense genomovar ulcerans]|uniref:BatA domain-containing protein n=1 Tax=Tenacibaculum finnmarkense TaxID=2781243 RepID=UPI001EFBA503|nr:BatA domain-containing protein [Tenacibaculum finnmarkense]MCG8236845.1 BatA domain-containing protein [Tenacibaculum finnmarkense genomovar ulcerans]
MQFKHPEILYFLVFLLIPILVHLFQLQRFEKVTFTNVAVLKKLVTQTRKSSRIKKWLILATRLLLLTALILAFAQPYFGNHKSDEQQHFFIYLDTSLSTNTAGEKGDLLQVSIQEIIENTSEKAHYSLLTNTNYFQHKTADELKDILLNVKNTAKKMALKTVFLKMSSELLKNKNTKNIIISDFQNIENTALNQLPENTNLVQLNPQEKNNISIDSIFINTSTTNNFDIEISIKNQGNAKKELPISLYNNDKLINKQVFSIAENDSKKVVFSIVNTADFLGKIELNFKDTYSFDNSFYFAINANSKIKILSIGKNTNFLKRIYSDDEFDFKALNTQNLNYNLIEKQHLIILNEIDKLPETLIASLVDFSKKGGNLVIIPSKNAYISSYNNLLKQLKIGSINTTNNHQKNDSLKITTINYKHPLFKNVFEKEIKNFQYPFVKTAYNTAFKNANTMLSFENKRPFIQQVNTENSTVYFLVSPLNKKASNFINSPLIVPVFYSIAKHSLQLSKSYYTVDTQNSIAINGVTSKNNILSISNTKNSFIPLQQALQNSVKITTNSQPLSAGFYQIKQQENVLKNMAFNYPKQESLLHFLNIKTLENKTISNSVKKTLINSNNEHKIQWLWKWFLLIAIVSLLVEILILKFFKP